MNIIKKAIKEIKELDTALSEYHTPRFSNLEPATPLYTGYQPKESGVMSPPPNIGSSIQHPKKHCIYITPCGWCTKWDKKCDEKPYKRGLRININPIDDACGVNLEEIKGE